MYQKCVHVLCMQQLVTAVDQQHLEILVSVCKLLYNLLMMLVAYFWFEWVLNTSDSNQRQVGDDIICVVPVWRDIGGRGDVPM